MYKIDLHSHSTASPDGGITTKQYEKALKTELVDYIAITDHNNIDFALELHKKIGKQIIVGEEIMSADGEIVGLFLTKLVPAGLSAKKTIQHIKSQGGLVYLPHPFETMRKGLSGAMLAKLHKDIDIIECFNGRALFQNKSKLAIEASEQYQIAPAASSDAHGFQGLGTHTVIKRAPTRKNLVAQLSSGIQNKKRPGIRAVMYPKYNVISKFRKNNRESS